MAATSGGGRELAAVAAGAAIGACGRHQLQVMWQRRAAATSTPGAAAAALGLGAGSGRPALAVLAINVVGSFALGAITAAAPGRTLQLGLGTGVCGGFTTYSTFAMDTVRLIDAGKLGLASSYAIGSAAGSVAAAAAGYALVKRVKR